MKMTDKRDIAAIFSDGTPIDEALKRAVREALIRHQRLGNPVSEWRDGRVVWVKPEDIFRDEEAQNPGGGAES
jgi:hypothetical protein